MVSQTVSKDPIAIVGATGGIGQALCRRLNEQGSKLHLVGRDQGRLDALAEELTNTTTSVISGPSPSAIRRAVCGDHQQIAAVACCAGSLLLKSADRTSDPEWQAIIEANLNTAFGCVQVAPKVRSGGSIVLVSSAAADIGLMNHEAIACMKAGIQGLVRAAAATYAKRGVRVNAVAPGLTQTPMTTAITGHDLTRKASEAMHALGRLGEPDDIAAALAFLLSDEAAWITGQTLGVDGGLGQVRTR